MAGQSRLRVSDNKRFLVLENGTPFFYLGDTAWELFHRLDREEADYYLQAKAAQKFTVIQAVILAEYNGLTEPNRYGHVPLKDNDPAQPNEEYFQHVDYVVNRAASLGLYVAMLPTWGDKVNKKWGIGPEVFTPENARTFGTFLGSRYANQPIIWMLGGDRPVESEQHLAIWRAMAAGLKLGDDGRHLITYHNMGRHSSSDSLHHETWLDFNTCQSGHNFNNDNYQQIEADYNRTPIKPCLDAEPGYEDHPAAFNKDNGFLDQYDVRKFAYWALFAGAHGHTYGCHDIWQFFDPARHESINHARTPWREAVHLPGATQMQYARKLMESRPFLTRIPDQSLLASAAGTGPDHVQATRSSDGSYAFIYCPSGKPVGINMDKLSGETVWASWYDPRQGTTTAIGDFHRAGILQWTPPSSGPGQDWILVLDDAARNFPPPG
ncbi:MAG: glycoside hydrolase family 140 protein [Abitibacteriaceae bacterium]|nr:glycoside hydrolase family 140 protein [Abditibacteriaceae bacterium]MBV9867309.1 glycoside hydrolase family 140 protein [Abditibacteriaceae bacterium]